MSDQNKGIVTGLFASTAAKEDSTLSHADAVEMYNQIGITSTKLVFLALIPDLVKAINQLDQDNNKETFAQSLQAIIYEAESERPQKRLKNSILMMSKADPVLEKTLQKVGNFSVKAAQEIAEVADIDLSILEQFDTRLPLLNAEDREKLAQKALQTIRPLQTPQQRINLILHSLSEKYQDKHVLLDEEARDDRFISRVALDIAMNFHAHRDTDPQTISKMVVDCCRPHIFFALPPEQTAEANEIDTKNIMLVFGQYAEATARQSDLATISGHKFAADLLNNIENPEFDPTPPAKLKKPSFTVITGGLMPEA